MTQREFLTAVQTGTVNEEVQAYATEALAKLTAKVANRKPTATQKENEVLVAKMFAAMETGVTYTAAQLGELIGVTTQKATALAKMLVAQGVATQTEVKVAANKAAGVKGGKFKGYTALEAEVEVDEGEEG